MTLRRRAQIYFCHHPHFWFYAELLFIVMLGLGMPAGVIVAYILSLP